ncbi:hypothetical protein Skr01_61840 [Sphaerisporangium krabiense]|uniref:Uncharacterized protein n=1 Tax=Sphaerisporangium krabiense TaxID=763782 RepID=A0A7W8Z2V7_9ACTN|nr:hypothetical protein [Sphaerisporangium krabiense]MBB5626235.1 hypothetical protein [Sphaerisporangium krabiense]GII66099.1 hypothetical protein Skr01_61840 [Sphaerisporangium krabiense]
MSFLFKHYSFAPEPSLPKGGEVLSFLSPAAGEAFDFAVSVRLRLLAGGRRRSWAPDREEVDRVGEFVRRTVRGTTRGHSVFDVVNAEAAVNQTLDRRLMGVSHDDPAIISRWGATAELALPERVKEVRRAHEIAVYELDAQAKVTERRVDRLRESSGIWTALLDETTRNPYARYAVRLTQNDASPAEIVERMLDTRREDADQLLTLVAKIVNAQQAAGVVDLVLASDTALRAAFQRLGVPLPPADPDSPFAPLDPVP